MTNEEKQQLTISLCGYLPYSLKVQSAHGTYELSLNNSMGGPLEKRDLYSVINNEYKPILRSMDQLTKEISQANYNDEKPFVPYNEIKRLTGRSFDYSNPYLNFFAGGSWEGGTEEVWIDDISQAIELLNQWFFNWRNLPAHLFVDVDSLSTNPYE